MPQMAPLLWALLFIFFLITVLLISSNIYFMKNNTHSVYLYDNMEYKKILYWKW